MYLQTRSPTVRTTSRRGTHRPRELLDQSSVLRCPVLYVRRSRGGTTIHRHASSQDAAIRQLSDLSGKIVLIMDEADQLSNPELFYQLYEIPSVTQILITQQEAILFGSVDARLQSRLQGCEQVQFDSYGIDELVDILQKRATIALAPDSITESQLRIIADYAAGDARFAITILRSVANAAQSCGATHVTEEHIVAGMPAARKQLRTRDLASLRPIQRLLYAILYENTIEDNHSDAVDPNTIYEEYRKRAENLKSDRTIRSHLNNLKITI